MSDPLDLDAVRELLEGVTPGPWECWEVAMAPGMGPFRVTGPPMVTRIDTGQPCFKVLADAEFIAQARTLVPELLDALETVRRHRSVCETHILERAALGETE